MYAFIFASSAVWVTGGSGMWSDWQERWRASIRRCRQEHGLSVTVCMYALVFASFAAQVPSVVNSIVGDSRRWDSRSCIQGLYQRGLRCP